MAIALLLGGGAPTLTLESGALAAFVDNGVEFDIVSTAGAGMVIGLLYAAPKGMTRQEALANTKNMGVHDAIYDQFPVNFKVFHKPGPMADLYRNFLQMVPRIKPGDSSAERLFSDWMAMTFSSLAPSDMNFNSQGLCAPAPWIDEVVDFDKLHKFPGEFYMNAYNVTDHEMEIFEKKDITTDHFHAALAFPFIYPASKLKLNGKTYIEGSAIDTLCFKGLLEHRKKRLENPDDKDFNDPIKHIVVLDVLSSKRIIREPRNLYDAWIQSIMIPLVEIAKDDVKLYEDVHSLKWEYPPELMKVDLESEIPDSQWPHILDWSYSNLEILYDAGYRAGEKFYHKNKEIFKGSASQKIEPILKKDSVGPDVKWLQEALGFSKADQNGKFDSQTIKAVERFQRKNDLKVDGEVGPETRRWLELDNKRRLLKKEDSVRTDVKRLQKALGFSKADQNGEFDSQTIKAVRRFQRKNDLKVDGKVGPETLRQLGLA